MGNPSNRGLFLKIGAPTSVRVICSFMALYVTVSLGISDEAELATDTLGLQAKAFLLSALMRFGGDVLIIRDFPRSSGSVIIKGLAVYVLFALICVATLAVGSNALGYLGVNSLDVGGLAVSSFCLAIAVIIALFLQAKGYAVLALSLQFGLQPVFLLLFFTFREFFGFSSAEHLVIASSVVTLVICLCCFSFIYFDDLRELLQRAREIKAVSVLVLVLEIPLLRHIEAVLMGVSGAALLWLPVLLATEVLSPSLAQGFIVLHRIAFAVSMLRTAAVARLAPEWATMIQEQNHFTVRTQWRDLTLILTVTSVILVVGLFWFVDLLLSFLGLGDNYFVAACILFGAQFFSLACGPSATVLAMSGRLKLLTVSNFLGIIISGVCVIYISPDSPFTLAAFFVLPMISVSGALWFIMCTHSLFKVTNRD